LSLAELCPALTVMMIEPRRPARGGGVAVPWRTVGEAVPPTIRPYLDQLGVLAGFEAAAHARSHCTLSAWGGPQLVSNEFLLRPEQAGWRLDRARLDQMLRDQAVARGARLIPATLIGLGRAGDGWHADLRGDSFTPDRLARITAGYVVDASGRPAIAARLAGRPIIHGDRQVAAVVWLPPPGAVGPGDPGPTDAEDAVVVIEACAFGWWYTAGLPGGGRVVACMSDADLAHRLRLKHAGRFAALVGETTHISRLAAPHVPPAAAASQPAWPSPRLVAAGTARLAHAAGDGLIAVGDAAMAFDPIAALGILKALRSGRLAAYAITDRVRHGDDRGFARYQALAEREFAAYGRRHVEVYRQEGRWCDATYWSRRHRRAFPLGAQTC
jgi:flavin-dependent dehydrogenase